jgi:hypothetical protein
VGQLGQSVAIDGSVVAAGAPREGETFIDEGAVYIYRKTGSAWALEQKLTPPAPEVDGWFGIALALSGDALLVGASGNSEAYVFRNNGSNWSLEGTLLPTGSPNDFGRTVAFDGETALIGNGTPGIWGFPTDRVWAFRKVGVAWESIAVLNPPNDGNAIGASAAMANGKAFAGDPGTKCTDGSIGCGSVYEYTLYRPDYNCNGLADVCEGIEYDIGACCTGLACEVVEEPACALDGGTFVGADSTCGDCDENQAADACEILEGQITDCNGNAIPDECDVAAADCNQNGVPDECDAASGTSEDCNDNLQPDECEPDADCNKNDVLDICDIGAGTSEDVNEDGIPDECCPPPCIADALMANTFGTCTVNNQNCDTVLQNCSPSGGTCDPCNQIRYLSFRIPDSSAGMETAIRIRLADLHNPVPPPLGSVPSFEVMEGGFRYLNTVPAALSRCCNPTTNPLACNTTTSCNSDADCSALGANNTCYKNLCPDSTAFATYFRCGLVRATPEYRDWSDFSDLVTYATGASVSPSSVYGAAHLSAACMGNEEHCFAASPEITITTERWGNVDCSNANNGIPTASDIALVTGKMKDVPGAVIKPRAHVRAAVLDPMSVTNAQGVGRMVDAVKGMQYPFHITCSTLCDAFPAGQCGTGGSCVIGRCTVP